MKICWAQALFIIVVIVLGTSSIITACGQKGPLYLPGDPQHQSDKQKKKQ